MKRMLTLASIIALIAVACGSSEETTTTAAVDDTTTSTTTTTVAEQTTTTAAESTTTSAPSAAEAVASTTAIGVLQPYSAGGGDLFPPGSVEAHWYQWDGSYVVLYRGFDAAAGNEICAGSSIEIGSLFSNVTNSPYLGEVEEICVDAASIATAPQGVDACGALLYYLTEIPIDAEGILYGTLKISTVAGFEGQNSQTAFDATVPEFEPGLEGYDLPPSDVDAGGEVSCPA